MIFFFFFFAVGLVLASPKANSLKALHDFHKYSSYMNGIALVAKKVEHSTSDAKQSVLTKNTIM